MLLIIELISVFAGLGVAGLPGLATSGWWIWIWIGTWVPDFYIEMLLAVTGIYHLGPPIRSSTKKVSNYKK
jgi:hypothetical protein